MMSSNKPEAAAPLKAKRKNIIGTLYNPKLGDSIRPVGQTFNLFIRLLAIVFAMNGLFPKDHPALKTDEKFPYTISDIVGEAWSRLQFTKEGLPKVILFFAVIGALLCAALSIISIFFVVLTGRAHAQAYFTPANPTSDIGFNIIDYLFSPTKSAGAYTNLSNSYTALTCPSCSNPSALPNTNIQAALWPALGYYSNGMLVFGGIILFYHLMSMVVETAQSGVVMGRRASQVWAPIRLAVAVILLVPVNSGLNSGQMIVMQMAQWGSGLASNVWDAFKLAMGTNSGKIAIPDTPDVTDVTLDVIRMGACEYVFNFNLWWAMQAGTPPFDPTQFVVGWTNGGAPGPNSFWDYTTFPITPAGAPYVETLPDKTVYHFQPSQILQGQNDVCGSYTLLNPPSYTTDPVQQQVAMAMYNAQVNAFNNALPNMMQFAANIQTLISDDGTVALEGQINLNPGGLTVAQIITNYQNDLDTQIAAANAITFGAYDPYAMYGWVGAAAYFNRISNVQSVAQTANDGYMPITKPPGNLGAFEKYLTDGYLGTDVTTLPPAVPGYGGGCAPLAPSMGVLTMIGQDFVKKFNGNAWDSILTIVNDLGKLTGVWCGDGSLGVHFTGSNPLAQIAAWGNYNISFGMDLLNMGTILVVAGELTKDSWFFTILSGIGAGIAAFESGLGKLFHIGNVPDTSGSKATDHNLIQDAAVLAIATLCSACAIFIGHALLPFAILFISLGFLFGCFLPLLPFLHFFFGTITWIGILFEAVFAMPLVAIAHINPNGEGLPGDQARAAYFMAFSILLRPTLMIFGLIGGFMCLMLATTILNMFFQAAFAGNGGSSGHDVLIKIMYTVIYVSVLVSVANHAFQLITHIPDHIMAWMGGQGVSGTRMGETQSIESRATAATGFVTSKAIGGVNTTAQSISGAKQAQQARVTQANQQGVLDQIERNTSDINLKENIVPVGFENGWPIYEFNYIGDTEKYIGVMAQDIEKIMPEAVCWENGHKAVYYGMIGVKFRKAPKNLN